MEENASVNKSIGSKPRNSTMADLKFNSYKTENNSSANINNNPNNNNASNKNEYLNNYNPNLNSNKNQKLRKNEQEIYEENTMQKLEVSASDDQLEKKKNVILLTLYIQYIANPKQNKSKT